MSNENAASVGTANTGAINIRKVVLKHAGELPSDYSQTPGGTLFSTTPGGTRIVYERNFLMQCRNSPLAKSPLQNLPEIPGVTSPDTSAPKQNGDKTEHKKEGGAAGDEPQFEMDI